MHYRNFLFLKIEKLPNQNSKKINSKLISRIERTFTCYENKNTYPKKKPVTG